MPTKTLLGEIEFTITPVSFITDYHCVPLFFTSAQFKIPYEYEELLYNIKQNILTMLNVNSMTDDTNVIFEYSKILNNGKIIKWVFFENCKRYEVVAENGKIRCTCDEFSLNNQECRHIKKFRYLFSFFISDERIKKYNSDLRVEVLPPPNKIDPISWISQPPAIKKGYYTNKRFDLEGEYFGIEFEIPAKANSLAFCRLEKYIKELENRDIFLCYENDRSVKGGEIKTKPLTRDKFIEAIELFQLIRTDKLLKKLFIDTKKLSGFHVHINISDFDNKDEIRLKAAEFGKKIENKELQVIFGRDFNFYADRIKDVDLKKYRWIHFTGKTLEVKLGNSKAKDYEPIAKFCLILSDFLRDKIDIDASIKKVDDLIEETKQKLDGGVLVCYD